MQVKKRTHGSRRHEWDDWTNTRILFRNRMPSWYYKYQFASILWVGYIEVNMEEKLKLKIQNLIKSKPAVPFMPIILHGSVIWTMSYLSVVLPLFEPAVILWNFLVQYLLLNQSLISFPSHRFGDEWRWTGESWFRKHKRKWSSKFSWNRQCWERAKMLALTATLAAVKWTWMMRKHSAFWFGEEETESKLWECQ